MTTFQEIVRRNCPNTLQKYIDYAERGIQFLYENPKRPYHNMGHVLDCLGKLDDLLDQMPIREKDIVALALIYHDCIYVPPSTYNEERSAEKALLDLKALGFYDHYAEWVYDHIMLTTHKKPCSYLSGQIIMDIDMSILGAPEKVFWEYEHKIRVEYSFVSDPEYREGRCKFLEGCLKKEYIFQTGYFREKYEETARKNIEHLNRRLKEQSWSKSP